MMERGLLEAAVKVYRAASGDNTSTPEEIALKFANVEITEPIEHYSRISGKMPTARHILYGEYKKATINEILAQL
jgi:hypothetical protein